MCDQHEREGPNAKASRHRQTSKNVWRHIIGFILLRLIYTIAQPQWPQSEVTPTALCQNAQALGAFVAARPYRSSWLETYLLLVASTDKISNFYSMSHCLLQNSVASTPEEKYLCSMAGNTPYSSHWVSAHACGLRTTFCLGESPLAVGSSW